MLKTFTSHLSTHLSTQMGQQRPKLLMPARRRCAVLLVVLCVALLHVPNSSTAAPLTVVNTVNDIWSNVAMQAAEVRGVNTWVVHHTR